MITKAKLVLLFLLVVVTMFCVAQSGPIKIADIEKVKLSTQHPYSASLIEFVFAKSKASYIKVHFRNFNLSKGDTLTIKDLKSNDILQYSNQGKLLGDDEGYLSDFWSAVMFTDSLKVTFTPQVAKASYGFDIDKVAYGFPQEELNSIIRQTRNVCGDNDREEIECYEGTEIYEKAKAVCKLIIGGGGVCTGWLLGSEGHIMTNNHCISSPAEALDVDFMFNYQFSQCGGNILVAPDVVASTSTFKCSTPALDFAVVKLPVNPVSTYGYLSLSPNETTIGERIYLVQHPMGQPKKIAIKDDQMQSGYSEIVDNKNWLSFYSDSNGGSSGSPLFSYDDHSVVGLLFGGDCPNLAHSSENIIYYMNTYFPNCMPKDGITNPTSVPVLNNVDGLAIFPNPAFGVLNIEGFEVDYGQLLDAQGKIVSTFKTQQLSVLNLPAAVYYLKLSDVEGHTVVQKIVLTK